MDATAPRVALAGNPNSGKTSVFNRLTGLNQKVGNFPGVTVDKKVGTMALPDGRTTRVVDLPGLYSLYPHSPDQAVSLEVLLDPAHPDHPDRVVYVADAGNLERHLLLLTQIHDLGIPVLLCLNLVDMAQKDGWRCDVGRLERALDVPVFRVNGRTGEGLDAVREALSRERARPRAVFRDPVEDAGALAPRLAGEDRFAAYREWLLLQHRERLGFLAPERRADLDEAVRDAGLDPLDAQVRETMGRFDRIEPLVRDSLRREASGRVDWSDRLDRVLTHPVWGTISFFGVLLLLFQALFAWASLPMDLMDRAFSVLREGLAGALPGGWFADLLVDGLLPGIGGVLIFIPQIAILFLLVALMEESGYMARAVYLSDNLMRRFGLNGRSFVSLISGVACAVPAIMSARGINNPRERLATIFVTPFMPCSARLPVFALLIAFAVPREAVLGGLFNLQGLVMFGLYLLGTGAALGSAWLVRRFAGGGSPSYLMLELPDYQVPHWGNVGLTVWEKVRVFVWNAGRIIVVISLVLWALSAYGPGSAMKEAEAAVTAEYAGQDLPDGRLEELVASRRLKASWAGHLGRAIEPAIEPLGFDWKIGIALITSFAAREVFVGTMATIYGSADTEDKSTLSDAMRRDRHPVTGEPVYTAATAVSLLLFYVFAMQCMSTLAIVRRETGSWRIPAYQFAYMTGLAYLASLAAYQILA